MEINNSILGELLVVGGFSEGRQIRTRFHFNNCKLIRKIFLKKSFIFQKSTQNSDGFLVSKDRALMIGIREGAVEAIIEEISVLGVLVEDNLGDLDIAKFGVENGGFTKNINTFDGGGVFKDFTKKVIGGKAERVIDI